VARTKQFGSGMQNAITRQPTHLNFFGKFREATSASSTLIALTICMDWKNFCRRISAKRRFRDEIYLPLPTRTTEQRTSDFVADATDPRSPKTDFFGGRFY